MAEALSMRWNAAKRAWHEYHTMYLFMLPFTILFIIFVIAPVATSVYLSFTYYNMLEPPRWIGLSNYRLLFLEDDVFITAIKNTLIFAIITGPLAYTTSFILAWLINRLKFRQAYTLAFYAPSLTSGIAISVIWLYFFANDRYGLLKLLTDPIWLDYRTCRLAPGTVYHSACNHHHFVVDEHGHQLPGIPGRFAGSAR